MFKADKTGFFVVDVDWKKERIVLGFYGYDRRLRKRFSAKTAEALWDKVILGGLVSELAHAAYLGAELGRAEVALKQGLRYRQDEPLQLSERRR